MMGTYAVVEDGAVTNVVLWDGDAEEWQPPANALAVLLDDGSSVGIGWTYANGEFAPPVAVQPVLTPDQIKAQNTAMRDSLLALATNAIAPLQDAVDLGEATDGEVSLLKLWKQFRVAVNRVDLTPVSPAWPEPPAS